MIGRRRFLSVILTTVVACQPAGLNPQTAGQAVPPAVGVGTRATWVVASTAGLVGLDAEGRMLGRIVALPSGTMASSPTLAPGGDAIVFALARTAPEIGFGSDIVRVNLDGTDLRAVVRHERANVFYASPSFDRLTGLLYVHRRVALENLQTDDVVERIDPATGERRTILRDASEPTVSPDGKSIVFVHMDRGQQIGLWIASSDGTGARPFFKTRDQFWFLQAPRVSPNGREVVFSSAGHTQSRLTPAPAGGGLKLAHLEIPSDIFLAPVDGSGLRSIATTGDDIVPAWSPDGTRIAYVVTGMFWVIAAADGSVLLRAGGLGFFYGDPIWLR